MNAIYSIDMGGGKSSCRVMTNFSPTLDCAHQGEPVICKCCQTDKCGDKEKRSVGDGVPLAYEGNKQ